MTITAYIPCHNNERTIGEATAALRKQSRAADQYLFINDRCSDRSPEIARENGFQVIDLAGKQGLAAGRNLALRVCTSEILVGLDADVVAAENYLEKMHEAFGRHADKAAIGGRLEERFTDSLPDLWRSIQMPQHHGDREQVDPRLLYGATMACRVEAIRKIGGWDERCVATFDDFDLCNRLKNAGLHFVYAPDCRAWHIRRDTLDSVLRTFWNWQYVGYENLLADMKVWLNERVPRIWAAYRYMRVREMDHPTISAITLLMPWSMMIRDVFAMRKSMRYFADPTPLIAVAGDVLSRYGATQQFVADVQRWLAQLISSLEQTPGWPAVDVLICDVARHYALECIPDAAYWGKCEMGGNMFG